MPVTPDQERMIVWAAGQLRPHGARRWDAAGIAKFVAQRKHLAFHEVLLDVIACAIDPNAHSPAVIGKVDWRSRLLNVAGERLPEPEPAWDDGDRCAECSKPKHVCESIKHSGHEFTSIRDHARALEERRLNIPDTIRGCKTLTTEQETP
jgi:hypothetical protein